MIIRARMIIAAIFVIIFVLLTQTLRITERFAENKVDVYAFALICAYYHFLHDPTLVVTPMTVKELYQLEWRKKTREVGLPYVYDYLFFDLNHYVMFRVRKGQDATYRDLLAFIRNNVEEIYRKSGTIVATKPTATCEIDLDELIQLGDKWRTLEDPAPIFNLNLALRPTFLPFKIVSDRGGNNTATTFP